MNSMVFDILLGDNPFSQREERVACSSGRVANSGSTVREIELELQKSRQSEPVSIWLDKDLRLNHVREHGAIHL
jgi:hypothetical protein